jgi:hypothetical protein
MSAIDAGQAAWPLLVRSLGMIFEMRRRRIYFDWRVLFFIRWPSPFRPR